MSTLYLVVAVTGGVFNLGSGIASMLRLKIIYRLLDGAGIPHSWLVFPIGVCKAAGGLGLLVGVLWLPWLAVAAAIGLVLFWTCALYTHVLTDFWPKETVLTSVFIALAVASLGLGVVQ